MLKIAQWRVNVEDPTELIKILHYITNIVLMLYFVDY